jgi:sulfur-oxidizing protein SoxA
MKKILQKMAMLVISGGIAISAQASTPEEDLAAFQNFFKQRFPGVQTEEYTNGVYSIDPIGRENWEAIEEFPPYEPFIDEGQSMWETPFANGKTYQDCFPDGPAMASKFPYWNKAKSSVITLPMALNECRSANGEKPLKYKKGPINDILSYIAFQSRGQITNVVIPEDDPKALEAYENGKKFYYTRRGQLNFSCANCHLQNAGMKIRSDILSPALGHTPLHGV